MEENTPQTQTAIRSYVRRIGRMTDSQKNAFLRLGPKLLFNQLNDPSLADKLHSFDRVVLEIGIGNGNAICHIAHDNNDTLFLGVEVHDPGIGRCMMQVEQENINNICLYHGDAIELLKKIIESDIRLDGLLVWFPDPWHKKRHHKRRIFNDHNLTLMIEVLKAKGFIHFASDWQPYVEVVEMLLSNHERLVALSDLTNARLIQRPNTHFERRGEKKGHQISDLIFIKNASKS